MDIYRHLGCDLPMRFGACAQFAYVWFPPWHLKLWQVAVYPREHGERKVLILLLYLYLNLKLNLNLRQSLGRGLVKTWPSLGRELTESQPSI